MVKKEARRAEKEGEKEGPRLEQTATDTKISNIINPINKQLSRSKAGAKTRKDMEKGAKEQEGIRRFLTPSRGKEGTELRSKQRAKEDASSAKEGDKNRGEKVRKREREEQDRMEQDRMKEDARIPGGGLKKRRFDWDFMMKGRQIKPKGKMLKPRARKKGVDKIAKNGIKGHLIGKLDQMNEELGTSRAELSGELEDKILVEI